MNQFIEVRDCGGLTMINVQHITQILEESDGTTQIVMADKTIINTDIPYLTIKEALQRT